MPTGKALCQLLLVFLPLTLSGCCTYLTVDASTHAFRHDTVRRIDRAVVTPEDKLVIQVEGATAESSRVGPFTITVSLPTNEDGIRVPREGMTKGWESGWLSRKEAVPITVAPPVILPAYYSASGNQQYFSEMAGAERTLYLVQHSKPDRETPLLYVEKGQHLRKIEINPDGRDVKTPGRYPFLLFVPVAMAVDIATLPVQIYFLSTYGDKAPPPASMEKPAASPK